MEEFEKINKNLLEEVLKLMNDAIEQMSLIRANQHSRT